MDRELRNSIAPLVIVLCVAVLGTCAYFWQPEFLRKAELAAYDMRIKARGVQAGSGKVVIIAIDEESIRRVGRWPWSRAVMARLASALDAAGVKAAVYDIGFFDPEPKPAQDELVALIGRAKSLGLSPTPAFQAYLKERLSLTNPDALFAQALAASSTPQILGYYMQLGGSAGSKREMDGSSAGVAAYPVQKRLGGAAVRSGDETSDALPLPLAVGGRANLALLAKPAAGQAAFNVLPDTDGTVRRYQMAFRLMSEGRESVVMPLAAALFGRAVPESPPSLLLGDAGIAGCEWGRHVVFTDEQGRMILNYRGPGGTIPHIPAWRLLDMAGGQTKGNELRRMMEGKFVVAGVTAPAVFDMRTTPYETTFPGVEIHATALDNMFAQDAISRPAWAALADVGAIWTLCLACLLLFVRTRPLFSLAGCSALFVGSLMGNEYVLVHKLFWLNLVFPLLALTASFIALNTHRFLFVDRERRQMRAAFNRYLDRNVVQEVMENPQQLRLGGETRELTVLFCDIVGFTTFSERMEPEVLVQLLNRYLTCMTKEVMRGRGLLDKYIGDAVMAVFGAPLHFDEHAEAACRTALRMLTGLNALNTELQREGFAPLRVSIGIHTGEMVAGNMGSEERMSYTVIGDAVNIASRLEGQTRKYGCTILCSEATYAQVHDKFWMRPVDRVQVRGREGAVAVYELLGRIEEDCPVTYLSEYYAMLEAMESGNIAQALELAVAMTETAPEDGVAAYYRRLLEEKTHAAG
ncbi:adenylate/guanylate cyclase domain-containing protein [Desulfovibrio mangrovi]|uniref:CHASE2 domain-containing protein n=1 Tax=Desulfovibrio mangrovi TaxID=2976983 RepID=UPI00224539F5|nr:adenylate/guanylate cyclase domain-containing protein [Desulfovibrio mangrovi]UZP67938.1 adenylate/guanylate cyclase domain-containing protein [Desulfovibrio mangrovi]